MAASFLRKLFDRSSARRKRVPRGKESPFSLRSSRRLGGLAAAESLESRAMLAVVATELNGAITLTYSGATNEALVEISEYEYSVIDTTTAGIEKTQVELGARVSVIDVLSQTSYFFEIPLRDPGTGVVRPLSIATTGAAGNDSITLQTSQAGATFQLVGIGDAFAGKATGSWQGELSTVVALNLVDLDEVAIRSETEVSVSGDFSNNPAADPFLLDVTSPVINAGIDGAAGLTATDISLRAAQINVGNLGIDATDSLVLTSSGGLTVASVAGSIEAKNSLSVAALNDISIGPGIDLSSVGGTVNIVSSAGALSLGGSIKADDAISLQAKAGTAVVGAITSTAGDVTVVDLGDVVLGGAIKATAGTVSVTSQTGLIEVVGGVTSKLGIDLTAGSTVELLSLETTGDATGPITIVAGGATAIVGGITTKNSDLSISSTGNLSVGGAVDVGTGAVALTGVDVALAVPAKVTAAEVTVQATGVATLGGLVTATGAVKVEAAGPVTLAGVQSADPLSLTKLSVTSQAGSVNSSGGISVTDAATITAATTATVNGAFEAGSATVTANDAILVGGAIQTTGNLIVKSVNSAATVLGGITSTAGNVEVASSTVTTINGDIDAQLLVSIDGIQSVVVAGSVVAAADNIVITSLAGSVRVDGALETKNATDEVQVKAATDASIGGAITTNNGAVTLEAASGALSLSGTIKAGTVTGIVTALSGGDFTSTVGATIDAEKIRITSGGVASLGGALTAQSGVAVKAEGNLGVSGDVVTTDGTVSLASIGGGVSIAGDVESTNDNIAIESRASTVGITGSVGAEDLISVDAVAAISIAGTIDSNVGEVRLKSATGSIASGTITAIGNLVTLTATDTAAGSITVGDVTSKGIVLKAGLNATIGEIDATPAGGGDVVLEAVTGSMLVTGDVLTDNDDDVSLVAGKDITVQTTSGITSGAITTVAGGVTTIDGALVANDAAAAPIVITSTSDVSITGNVSAGVLANGAVKISSQSGSLTAVGAITAVGGAVETKSGDATKITGNITGAEITVAAVGDLEVIGVTKSDTTSVTISSTSGNVRTAGVTAKTTLDVVATTGDLSVGGLESTGAMTVEAAAGDAVFSGALVSGGSPITVSAGGQATFNATASINAGAADVTITASGDLTAFAGAGVKAAKVSLTGAAVDFGATIDAEDAVTVFGSGNVRLGQTVTATDAIQVSGVDVSVNKLVSTVDSVTVAAAGTATFSGPVAAAQGDVKVDAANVVSQAASTFSALDVSIKGSDTVLINGSVTATGVGGTGMTIAGTNDTKVIGDLTTTGDGNVTVSGGPLFISGDIDSAGILDVGGADAVTITGSLNAAGNIKVDAVAALAVNGDIKTAADVAVVGSDAVAVNGSVAATNITVTGIKATAINGGLTAGAKVTLSSEDSLSVSGAVDAVTTLAAQAKTSLDFGGVVSAAGVTANAGGDLTALRIDSLDDVKLTAGGELRLLGITSAGAVSLTGGTVAGDVNITGGVQITKADAPLNITSDTGSVGVVGSIAMNAGNITVKANGDDSTVTVGDIEKAGIIDLEGDKIQAGGPITGTSFKASGTSSVDVNGVITATAAGGVLDGVSITATGVDGTVTVNSTVDAQGGSPIFLLAAKSATALGLLQTVGTGTVDVIVAAAPDSQGSLSVLSVETEDGAITLQSGSNNSSGAVGSISVLGGIKSTNGSFTATSVGGNEGISLNGVDVGGSVRVIADGGIDTVAATKGSDVTFSAGTTADIVGSVTTTVSLLEILANEINVTGALDAAGAMRIDSSGNVSLRSAVTGVGNVEVSSEDATTVTGQVVSTAGKVDFRGSISLSIVNNVTAADGIQLQAFEGVAVTGDLLSSTGKLEVLAGSAEKNGGNVSLIGDVTNQDGEITISAGQDPSAGSVGSVSVLGDLQASGADGDVTVTSIGDAQGTTITGSIDAGGVVSLTADGAVSVANGVVAGNQGVLLTSGVADVAVRSRLQSATGIVRVSANAGVVVNADIEATIGSISIQSDTSSLLVNPLPNTLDPPVIKAGTSLFLSAGSNISSIGELRSGGVGPANVSGMTIHAGTFDGGGDVSLASIVFTAGGDLAIFAGLRSDATANGISISGAIDTAGGDITITAGLPDQGGSINISSAVKAGAGEIKAVADIFALSAVASIGGGDIKIAGAKTATIDGTVTGTGTVAISGTATSLTINNDVTSGGALSLRSNEGALAINDNISSGGSLTLQGGTTVTVSSAVTAVGDIVINAVTGDVDVNNAITSKGGGVEVRSAESAVNVEDSISAAGLLEIAAHADALVGAVAPLTSTGGSIVVGSTTGTITINESVSAGLNVRIAAPQAIVLSGNTPVDAKAGWIRVASSGSTVALNDSLTAKAFIDVSANGSIATSPNKIMETEDGDITFSSSAGKIEFLSKVMAGRDFKAGAFLAIDTKTDASVAAGGSVSISSASSTVTLRESVAATTGTITLTALDAIEATNSAPLSAGGGISIRSNAGTVTLAEQITAGEITGGDTNIFAQLAIVTGDKAEISAGQAGVGGSLSVFSQSESVTLGASVTADQAINIRGGTFILHRGDVPMVSKNASVTLTANAGAVTVLGNSPITAETTIKIDANGAGGTFTSGINSPLVSDTADVLINTTAAMLLGVTSGITAGDEIILEASGSDGSITTSINADLEAGGGISLRSDASFIKIGAEATITSTGGGVGIFTNAGGGAITIADSSRIAADGNVEIVSNSSEIRLSSAVISDAVVKVRALGGSLTTTSDLATIQGANRIELQASEAISLNGGVSTNDTENGTVELISVTGVTASGNAPIVTGDLNVFNGTAAGVPAGDISLTSPGNALGDVTAGMFSAVNKAGGGAITFVHSRDLETGLVSTSNGDIEITQVAAGNILITDRIAAGTADIAITSQGQLSDSGLGQVAAENLVAQNRGGTGDILLNSILNDVVNAAIRNFAAGEEIVYVDATDLTINVSGEGFRTDLGDITVQVGSLLTLDAEVYADQDPTQDLPVTIGTTVSLTAVTGIEQTAAQVVGNNVVLANGTGPINLTSTTNDTQQLAAFNLGGAITYVDVSDFETGVVRTQNGQPVGYEIVTPGVLTLQAGAGGGTGSPSVLRVVSGLQYGSLFLRAGDSDTGDVGVVEYVTTSNADNTAPGPAGGFSGTLRDMITYGNENRARQTINGVARVQPQLAVFDEQWYPVRDIILDAGLPVVVQPLSIDGTRVENTVVDFDRVGIDGSGIPGGRTVHGLEYGRGSSDSLITGLALYGFKTGAGISLGSGVNTITNTYAGLTRNGAVYGGDNNLVGIQLDGRLSTKNTIGTIEADDLQANTIGGNAFAGIVVRGGASSNTIVGNYVGTNANEDPLGNDGDGIRIDRSNTNFIGTQTAQRPNLQAALSNVIRFNAGSGIRITESQAPARALGNAIENNFIDGNDLHGIHIVSSARQTVGGDMPNEGNVIGLSGIHGIYMQSTKASQIIANRIGLDQDFFAIGNGGSGIRLQASTDNVIDGGNQIGHNLGAGIELLEESDGNRVEGNFIGITIDENTDLFPAANLGAGVLIQQSLRNQVVADNLIANNRGTGVAIIDAEARNVRDGNVIAGNEITQNGKLDTGTAGILVQGGGYHTIGGEEGGNTISLNIGDGIRVEKGSLTGDSVSNVITGNFVGTNKFQEDLLGNTGFGISVSYGGSNVIAANSVFSNGVNPSNDADLGFDGIRIAGSSSNTIGSTALGEGNIVVGNGGTGIVVTDTVDTNGFGTVSLSAASVARFSRSQLGALTVGDTIVVAGFEYRITRLVNATTFSVAPVGAAVLPQPAQAFQIRATVANTGNVVYGNEVEFNAGNGIEVSGTQTNLVTVGEIGIPGRAAGGAANAITGNWGYGVLVTATGGVTIEGNTISGNGWVDEDGTVIGGGIKLADGANAGAVTPTMLSASVTQRSPGAYTVTAKGTMASEGVGTVSAASGTATFSTPQAALAVNDVIVVGTKGYRVTQKTSNTVVKLDGSPTFAVGGFRVLKANQIDQQYTIDLYLNQPWQGNADTGEDFQAATFLGRASLLVTSGATGEFTATFNYMASDTPLGMFVTATSTTTRPATGVVRYSTSELSAIAAMVSLPPSGPSAGSGSVLDRARALAFDSSLNTSTTGTGSGGSTSSTSSAARRNAFGLLGR